MKTMCYYANQRDLANRNTEGEIRQEKGYGCVCVGEGCEEQEK